MISNPVKVYPNFVYGLYKMNLKHCRIRVKSNMILSYENHFWKIPMYLKFGIGFI